MLGGVSTPVLATKLYAPTRRPGAVPRPRLVDRLATRPEVLSVSLGRQTPLSGSHNGGNMVPVGEENQPDRVVNLTWSTVDTAYFSTVRIPMLAGRAFDARDASGADRAVIINETAARRLWPEGGLIVGRRLRFQGGSVEYMVVGIVRDGRYRSLDEEPIPFAFLAHAQQYSSATQVFVRSRLETAATIELLRQETAALDPNVALERPRPLSADVNLWRIPQRIASGLIGTFGLAGLLLAAIGLYGVLAYHVARRVREFGIRVALGASAPALRRIVWRECIAILVPGTLLGLALAFALARPMARFLYGIDAMDPMTFFIVPLVLAAVAVTASSVPARRAARVDPMVSLRSE